MTARRICTLSVPASSALTGICYCYWVCCCLLILGNFPRNWPISSYLGSAPPPLQTLRFGSLSRLYGTPMCWPACWPEVIAMQIVFLQIRSRRAWSDNNTFQYLYLVYDMRVYVCMYVCVRESVCVCVFIIFIFIYHYHQFHCFLNICRIVRLRLTFRWRSETSTSMTWSSVLTKRLNVWHYPLQFLQSTNASKPSLSLVVLEAAKLASFGVFCAST